MDLSSRQGRLHHPAVRDGLLAAALCVLDLAGQWEPAYDYSVLHRGPVPAWLVVAFAVAGYAVLAVRRRRPVLVLAVMWLHAVAALLWLPGYRPLLGLLLALLTVALVLPPARSWPAVPATLSTFALAMVDETRGRWDDLGAWLSGVVLFGALGVATWAVGWWAGRSRRQLTSLERRREEDARLAVEVERARIARELHDIVSHSVTIMVLQASGAQRVLATDAAMAGDALRTIQDVGTQAMDELRRMLGLLHEPPVPGPTGGAADPPVPGSAEHGLDELEDLVARFRGLGTSVEVVAEGDAQRLDPSVDHTAYRIVAEALTNATKHAGAGCHATVGLAWAGSTLTVTVANGPGGERAAVASGLSTGHGLAGLAARVAVVGGRLAHAPDPGGRYVVEAVLPTATSGPDRLLTRESAHHLG